MSSGKRRRTIAALAVAGAAVALAGCSSSGPVYHWIPGAAQVMTITETQLSGGPDPAPVTVTDAAQVRDIAAFINGLAPIPPDTAFSCPAPVNGKEFDATFRARAGAPVLARASLQLYECFIAQVTGAGYRETGLGSVGSAADVVHRIRQVTGLTWLPSS